MRRAILVLFCMALGLVPIAVLSGDIVSGWSTQFSGGGPSKIVEMVSEYSRTFFLLDNVGSDGCGNSQYWKLPMDLGIPDADKYKRATLLAAYMAGKGVKLRCENSNVTDFVVSD